MTAAFLLDNTKKIIDNYKKRMSETGGLFNVFSVLELERNEVKGHCRFIYELLDPGGSHSQGDTFLKIFFEKVLKISYPKNTPLHVYREYSFGNGRIDLLIKGKNFVYPIEVKIDAGDQKRQVERYYDFAKTKERHLIHYLTLYGDSPTEYSKGKCPDTFLQCISFSEDIKHWLEDCIAVLYQKPKIGEVVKQYLETVKKITGQGGEDMIMEVKALIDTPESFESACAIEKALSVKKIQIMKILFDGINEHMKRVHQLKVIDVNYETKADSYYGSRNGLPSISFCLEEDQQNHMITALRFEIDWFLYFGVAYFKKDKDCVVQIQKPSNINTEKWQPKNNKGNTPFFDWWEYLPQNSKIDFCHTNSEAYLQLIDDDTRNLVLKQIFDEIDEYLKEIHYERGN